MGQTVKINGKNFKGDCSNTCDQEDIPQPGPQQAGLPEQGKPQPVYKTGPHQKINILGDTAMEQSPCLCKMEPGIGDIKGFKGSKQCVKESNTDQKQKFVPGNKGSQVQSRKYKH